MLRRFILPVSLAVLIIFGFGLFNSKDPDPQKIDAAVSDVLKNQEPSRHDREPLLVMPPVWQESFDNATFPPAGWLNLQESGTGLWARATTTTYPSGFSPHSGAGLARFNSYTYSSGVAASLVSAVFSLTAGQGKLGFWMLRDDGYSTAADKVDFMINTNPTSSGATSLGVINRSKALAPVESGANGWYYYEFVIPPSFNTATNYIILKATSAYGNDIYVDDVFVTLLLAHDVGTQSVDVSSPQTPGTIVPKATFKNYGTSTETFPVTMTITPGAYTSTKNVTSLPSGGTNQVTFDNWTASNGTYTVKVISNLSGDLDNSNDTLLKTVVITNAGWISMLAAPQPVSLGFGCGYSKHDTAAYFFSIGGQANKTVCMKFNVKLNTWATIAPLPLGVDRGSGTILGDSLYCIAGANGGSTYFSTVYKYDINANTWTTRASLPVSLGWHKCVAYQDSLIYVVGGYNGTAVVNTVYLYNAKSNTWRTATSLPLARFGGGCAKVGDTLIYISGVNETGSALSPTVYEGIISPSDRSVITWTPGTPTPGTWASGIFRTNAAEWGCKGVVIGGGSTATAWTSVDNHAYIYNPRVNPKWVPLANFTTAITAPHSGSVHVSANQWRFLIMGGYSGSADINNTQVYADTLDCQLVGIENLGTGIPEEYSLSQNYPNPFNPLTKINFAVKTGGMVNLVVYNVLGKQVASIVNEYKEAGYYSVDFDASNLSSGIYFYQIHMGPFTFSKKMMLIK